MPGIQGTCSISLGKSAIAIKGLFAFFIYPQASVKASFSCTIAGELASFPRKEVTFLETENIMRIRNCKGLFMSFIGLGGINDH